MKRINIIGYFLLLPLFLSASVVPSSDSLARLPDTTKEEAQIPLLIKLSEQNRDKSVYDCKQYFKQAFSLAQKLNNNNMMGLAAKSMGVSYFYWGDMKNAFRYFKNGLHYYRKSGNKKGQSNCLNDLGLVYESWARFDSAAFYYKASYLIEKELGNIKGEATSLINMGNIEYYRKNYHGALQHYFEALKNFVIANDQEGIAMAYNSLSVIYTNTGEYNKALAYLEKARKIYLVTDNRRNLARVLNNMADIYSDHFKEYKKAENLYDKVLKIKQALGDKEGVALVKCNLGVLYRHMGILSQALQYFDESEKIYRQTGNKWGLSMVLMDRGLTLLDAGQYKKALANFKKSLAISGKVGLKDFTNNNYQGMFKCYAALGDYANFNKYYSLFEQNRDTLSQKLENIRIAELEAQFKIDTLLKQKKSLQQESNRKELKIRRYYLLSIGLSLFIVILILTFVLYRKAKSEAKKYKGRE